MSQGLVSLVVLLVVASLSSGCSVFPWWASVNEPDGPNDTAANLVVDGDVTADGMFVGLAISGGGSRAANFGAAVLFELQEQGLLEKVDFISSVSGGSLAAAAYGLRRYPPESSRPTFTRAAIDNLFSRDFELRWIGRWFYPWNALRYWVTAFDRSDMMAQVFEANVFHGATFNHLQRRPKVLINAVNFVSGRKFVFSNEAFRDLGSDLSRYPVARAVMASGAFPGVFANVTLRNYLESPGPYVHLFDGGPIDNLGVGTIVKVLQQHLAKRYEDDPSPKAQDLLARYGFPRGCLVISVDAYTAGEEAKKRRSRRADTRPWYGFLVDSNFMEAFDDLLAVKRNELLHELGLDKEDQDVIGSFPLFALDLDDDDLGPQRRKILQKLAAQSPVPRYSAERALRRDTYCHIWHIAISQLSAAESCPLGHLVNAIRTEYRIDKREQCGLFEAARTLVQATLGQADFRGLLERGFPTAGPIDGAPIRIPPGSLSCDQHPEPTPADGRQVCRLNAHG